MKKLKGKATILFDRDRGLCIELEDALSGISIKAELDNENTVAALSRMGLVDCEITYPDTLDMIGKKCETKRVLINKTWEEYSPERSVIEKQAEEEGFLVDGWSMWQDGTGTQQHERGKHCVWLERYVDAGDDS